MKIKFNMKTNLIIFIFFVAITSITALVTSHFLKSDKGVRINETLIQGKEPISNEILKYLAKKNIETNLPKKDLEAIYWVERIKEGGLILLFRHSEREKWNNTVEGFDIYELSNNLDARNESWYRATCLTDKGIEESKLIFEAIKHAQIRISEVISSPSCRARETSFYAFGRIDKTFSGLLHYTAFNPLDRKQIGKELKKSVLELNIEKDKNIILSAHNKVISHYDFIDLMKVGEGLEESGFYVIEKKGNDLIVPFKFSKIKNFIILLYRHEFEKYEK